MKFSYKFSNLIGTVYNEGNLLFTPDGTILISPVGNRITLYDLKNNRSETLPIECMHNFTTLALSPNGQLLIAVNRMGAASLISLPHRIVINQFHFKEPISAVRFSPNGKYIAVTKGNNVFIYQVPHSGMKQFNAFLLEKVFKFAHDRTLCIDWTSDSKVIAVGGADMSTKIHAINTFENLFSYTLGSHSDSVVGCFFESNSLNLYTVSKNGQLCSWECSVSLDGLIPKKKVKEVENDERIEDDIKDDEKEKTVEELKADDRFHYKRTNRHHLKDHLDVKAGYVALTAAAFHQKTRIMVVGYSNGSFLLYEMPDCIQIHSLSLSNQLISSIAFNCYGDWIALGSSGSGQLVVWEWQSESFIMKQQGHFNNLKYLAYSPEGMYIATGGDDGKVKLWDTYTGFCVVTFSEHASSITGVVFSQNGKVIISSSVDGTIRAFDLHRYRNFRTFTSPKPTQFSCLSIDPNGEIICAGSEENFELYVWAVPTGRLLSILTGHEAPVSGVSFSPIDLVIASTSWDKTVRLWNIHGSKTHRESIKLTSDGLAIAYRPDGGEIAVSSLDGQLSFFNVHTMEQTGSIEGYRDLHVGKRETDLVSAKTLLKSQAITAICYSADGECMLAAGRSKFVCIYNVKERILMKKFEITCNLSFDGIKDFISAKKMTEFGNKSLIGTRVDEEKLAIPLPGSRLIDKSSRFFKPEVIVTSLQFSPTGRSWAATSTEGLLVYSLDNNLVFDPFDIDVDITPENIRKALKNEDYTQAIMMSIRLNLTEITEEVIESIQPEKIETLALYLPEVYVERLLKFIVDQVDKSTHLEFYLNWLQHLLTPHAIKMKMRPHFNLSNLRAIKKNLNHKLTGLDKMCSFNKYMIQYSLNLGDLKEKKEALIAEEEEDEEEMLIDNTDCILNSNSAEESSDENS